MEIENLIQNISENINILEKYNYNKNLEDLKICLENLKKIERKLLENECI